MSKKNMFITIAASGLILIIGYFMIPSLNSLFFNNDKQISEQTSITSQLQQQADTFIQKLMFPVCDPLPTSQAIAGSDAEAIKADFKSYDSHPLSVLFGMYGLQYQDAFLDELKVTEDGKYYLFQNAISDGAQEYNVSFAIKDNTVVSFYCVAVESPTSENIKEAVDRGILYQLVYYHCLNNNTRRINYEKKNCSALYRHLDYRFISGMRYKSVCKYH